VKAKILNHFFSFQYMPELSWRWGYFIILFIMLLVGLSLVGYFKRKKWF
ncbi:Mg2+/Co2+ transporter, partial [Thermoplasmatales archaeon SCGC AB-540-F20]